ncbi:MAG: trypsin-like peptidase domain-containing protein [Chloroflexi bacterium]|nr:trypsin-like peptidase domain-containing protein [Chloroflexota bacterium]
MALIPPFFTDCVVAIGADDAAGERRWIASGFLYGVPTNTRAREYQVYLVTNRHVLAGLDKAYLRCNPHAAKPAREFDLSLFDGNKPLWFTHPDDAIDVAVMPIHFDLLQESGMQVAYFQGDQHSATIDALNALGVTEGDFAYVLGFPMGLVGQHRNTVIVRSGTLARVRDLLARSSKIFLVDAFVFPGNSGGPVVLKPEAVAIEGTKPQVAPYLIGVVQAYVPYQDVAISAQTGRPRVIFEENTGLAAVHPVDFIIETIAARFTPRLERRIQPHAEKRDLSVED